MNKDDSKGANHSGKKTAAGESKRKAENPRRKTILQGNKSEIGNSKSEISPMEVHHHPHLEHKHKPWKEYLLEGFMIFVAVMMGFIAENIREDITNREHARQLTSQLAQDLKSDTAQLNAIYAGEMKITSTNDTLFKLLQQPIEKADLKRIQLAIAKSHSLWLFHPSAGAISAIKNELHLKQFSNSEIIKYISRYEGHTELLHTVQDIALQYQRSFVDPFLRLHFIPYNLDAAFNHTSQLNAQMRNLSQEDLIQLSADIVLIQVNCQELLRDNRMLQTDAVNLLQYVTKRYDLDNE